MKEKGGTYFLTLAAVRLWQYNQLILRNFRNLFYAFYCPRVARHYLSNQTKPKKNKNCCFAGGHQYPSGCRLFGEPCLAHITGILLLQPWRIRRGIILNEANPKSGAFRSFDPPPPPPPHRPASVYPTPPPAFGAGAGHTRWVERVWGVNSSEDAAALYSIDVSTLWEDL